MRDGTTQLPGPVRGRLLRHISEAATDARKTLGHGTGADGVNDAARLELAQVRVNPLWLLEAGVPARWLRGWQQGRCPTTLPLPHTPDGPTLDVPLRASAPWARADFAVAFRAPAAARGHDKPVVVFDYLAWMGNADPGPDGPVVHVDCWAPVRLPHATPTTTRVYEALRRDGLSPQLARRMAPGVAAPA